MADKGIDIPAAELERPGKTDGINYLFAIAIDEYRHCPRLYNCVQDARRLIDVLTTHYQFEKQYIFTLFDEQATERAIIDMFQKMVGLIRPQDNLLILFSGHGEYEAAIDEGYWIPVDAPPGHTNEYIANSRIVKYIKAIPSQHTFLIVDSCFSGSLFASRSLGPAAGAGRLDEIPSRWLLTAGRNELVSDGKPGSHSPFADNVIYFLENNSEPRLSVAALIDKVVNAVIHNARQTPRGEPLQDVGHRGGQFYFHRKGAVPVRQTAAPPAHEKTQAMAQASRPAYRKYILAIVAALALIAFVLIRQVNPQGVAGNAEKREQINTGREQPSSQARYDSLLSAGAGLLRQAQYEKALGWFEEALRWAESNGLNTGPAEKCIRQCREMLPEPEMENPAAPPVQKESKSGTPANDYASLLARGRTLFQDGRFAAAGRVLEEALKINPQGREARTYLLKCREELAWQQAENSAAEEGYRNFLKERPDSRHAEKAQQRIAALYRYELYFTTALKANNQLTINIGRGKPPFDITITYLATGEQLRQTAPDTQPFEVSLSRFNSEQGSHMVEIVVRDNNFKAKGQKMPLMR